MRDRRSRLADRAAAALAWSAALSVAGVFAWIVGDLLRHGMGEIGFSFFIEAPRDFGRAGGIAPILVSTALILFVCMSVSLPLGLGAAALLAEFGSTDPRLARWVRRSLDVLAGVPSIVFGLFGYAFFCIALGMGYSILAGGLTLACMVLPLLIRATEEGFRAVPDEIRLGAAALGMSRSRTLFSLLLPAAAPGLIVGFALGVGRALAETAALLYTSGYVDRMPGSPMHSGRSLSIHVYDLAMNVPGGEARAYASAVALVGLLLAINLASSAIAGRRLRRGFVAA
jgi:phosphate transport system permease protein